jgi:hypothetical protein
LACCQKRIYSAPKSSGFSGLSNPTLTALSRFYECYKMSMNNATLLAQENIELCAAIQEEGKRRKCKKLVLLEKRPRVL